MDKSRNTSLDVLRIIAAFCVVMMNVCSRYILVSPVDSFDFNAANAYDSLCRFAVPLFVMISGALFLDKDRVVETRRLWYYNILRLIVIYVVWGFIYYVYQSILYWDYPFWSQGVIRTIKGITYGAPHLTFLGMIAGLYALVPVLRSWLCKATKQNVEYFLILFFVFKVTVSTIDLLLGSSLVSAIAEIVQISELSGYLGYFVLGYYLNTYEIDGRIRHSCYILVPLCIVLNYLLSWHFSKELGAYNPGIYDSFGVFTFIEAVAMFMLICRKVKKASGKGASFIINVSRDTLGIYLVNTLVLDFVFFCFQDLFRILTPSAIFVLPVSLGLFIVSLIMAALIRRIPVIGRYLA